MCVVLENVVMSIDVNCQGVRYIKMSGNLSQYIPEYVLNVLIFIISVCLQYSVIHRSQRQPGSVVLCCVALYWIALCCVAMCCVALCCVALCCVALYCVVLRCVVLRCVALCCVALCCVALRCVVLHCVDWCSACDPVRLQ